MILIIKEQIYMDDLEKGCNQLYKAYKKAKIAQQCGFSTFIFYVF